MPTRIPVPATVRQLWSRVPAARRLPLAVYASCQLVLLLWWAAFFPGLLSYDSIAYVWQVTTGNWLGNHSVLYDSFVWLAIEITGDLWLLTLAQTVVLSAALAYTCVALRDLGARSRWSATGALVLVMLPATGSFAVFVWKDSAFGISAVLAFAAAARMIARRMRGRQLLRNQAVHLDLAVLTAGYLGMALFRNNSVLVVLFAYPFLVLALAGTRRWITAITGGTTAVYLVLQFAVYPAVGIVPPRVDQVYAFNYADIAVSYGRHPGSFTARDKAVMAKVAPLSFWRGPAANCYDVDDTMAKPFDRKAAVANNRALLTVWADVLRRTPQDIAGGHLCRAHIAWAVWPGQAGTAIAAPVTTANLFGWADWSSQIKHSPYRPVLRTRPLSSPLHGLASWWYDLSTTSQLNWLLWRGAIWCYVLYAVAVVYARRMHSRPAYALVAITVGLQLTVIAANPAQLARYMVPPFYLGVMSLALLSAKRLPPGPAGPAVGKE